MSLTCIGFAAERATYRKAAYQMVKITDFNITFNYENILIHMGGDSNTDVQEEIREAFEEMVEEAYKKINTVALIADGSFEILDGVDRRTMDCIREEQGLFCLFSIGDGLGKWSSQLFAEHEYLKGMMADSMADDYLFQMEMALKEHLIAYGKARGYGIVKQLSIPHDLPYEYNKMVYETTQAAQQSDIKLLDSLGFSPTKTLSYAYLLKKDSMIFNLSDSCSVCPAEDCSRRKQSKIPVSVYIKDEVKVVECLPEETLLTALRRDSILIPALCNSRGTCGSCQVRVIEGEAPISNADKTYYTDEQLAKGYRLSCQCIPTSSVAVVLPDPEGEDIMVLSSDAKASSNYSGQDATQGDAAKQDTATYAIITDIGTTTIAMELINQNTGSVAGIFTTTNRQRSFGADVVSRIQASNEGHGEALKEILVDILKAGVASLIEPFASDDTFVIEKMLIAANTTITHLLMGYSCETLGTFPFQPVNIDWIDSSAGELLGETAMDFPIAIYPSISTYVGADITSGLYALGFHEQEEISILVDLGTNGEIALGNKERILVASTAVGPAFEGGNISCGCGGVPGAIYDIQIENGETKVRTLQDKAVGGICGTGIINLMALLVDHEIVDETGLMSDTYFDDGFVLAHNQAGEPLVFSQKDVREVQLAKAAIRAGLEALVLASKVSLADIKHVYIAGGFGQALNVEDAIAIGLLPSGWADKLQAVGNTSLSGLLRGATDPQVKNHLKDIVSHAEEYQLGNDAAFNRFYMEYMYFES